VTYQFNNVLAEIGAIDLSGASAAFGTVTQIGPVDTTFVIAGASSTAICADIGARKIREELDAIEVLGIDPINRSAAHGLENAGATGFARTIGRADKAASAGWPACLAGRTWTTVHLLPQGDPQRP